MLLLHLICLANQSRVITVILYLTFIPTIITSTPTIITSTPSHRTQGTDGTVLLLNVLVLLVNTLGELVMVLLGIIVINTLFTLSTSSIFSLGGLIYIAQCPD